MFVLTPLINIRHKLARPDPALTVFERLYLNNRSTDFYQTSVNRLEKLLKIVFTPISLFNVL